jgi:hypothetical protein
LTTEINPGVCRAEIFSRFSQVESSSCYPSCLLNFRLGIFGGREAKYFTFDFGIGVAFGRVDVLGLWAAGAAPVVGAAMPVGPMFFFLVTLRPVLIALVRFMVFAIPVIPMTTARPLAVITIHAARSTSGEAS